MGSYAEDLTLALGLADMADQISIARFQARDLVVTSKPDLTPVSDADRTVEQSIRERLLEHRPKDAVVGEELAATGGDADRRWIIDPIDGTKNYVRGVPVWATLIGLADRRAARDGDDTVVGVVSAPALARRWWAARGEGAFSSFAGGPPRRLSVSAVTDLADASLSYASLEAWSTVGRGHAAVELTERVWRSRGYGDFWSYMLVAEGAVDLAAEPELSLWDMAAVVPIVTEAGGRFTDLTGRPGPYGRSAAASNGRLHDLLLAALDPDQ